MQPVIFGTIYIPPEYTRYSSDEAFNQIEHELHSFSTNSKYVGLIGDFNSRTGEDDDYVNVNFEHGDNNIDEFIENHAGILENLNIPLKRKNIDKTKNKYGNMLLNQWTSEKRQLISCTVKFTNDLKKIWATNTIIYSTGISTC
jgi:hypothetical protein